MVTGASTADLAVMLVDARKGVLTQTRRHSYLAQLIGIRRLVLAVNKMDLVDYDQARVRRDLADYRAFAEQHRHRAIGPRSRSRASRATMSRAAAMRCPGTTGRACSSISTRSTSTGRRRRESAADAGAVGQPAQPGFPRLRRPDRVGSDRAGRRGARSAVGPDDAHRARSSPQTATSTRRWPGNR